MILIYLINKSWLFLPHSGLIQKNGSFHVRVRNIKIILFFIENTANFSDLAIHWFQPQEFIYEVIILQMT